MSHRTQTTLSDSQYERLLDESDRSGRSLAELVRQALDRTYGPVGRDGLLDALDESFGSWTDREGDGDAYVDRLRRGMTRRLADA